MPIALPQTLRRLIANVPLHEVLVVPFVLQTVAAVALVGYLSYRSGQESVADLGQRLVAETNERVTQELKTYLQTPLLINRLNVDAVNQGQIDPQDVPALEAALFNRLQQFDQVSAVLFANPQGTFRVVERLPELHLVVADPPRPDKMLVYRLDNQGKRGQLVYTENGLDIHDRPWYKRAVKTGQPGWAPISQYGSLEALTLNTSQPVYDPITKRLLGVFTVHTQLDYLSKVLQRLDISRFGRVMITDQGGALIATSLQEKLYKVGAGTGFDKQLKQLTLDQSRDDLTRSLGEYLRDRPGTLRSLDKPQYLEFSYKGELQNVKITPFQDQYGLNLQVVTVIPKSHFVKAIQDNTYITVLFSLLTLGAAISLGLLTAHYLTARFAQLNRVSRELAAGNLNQRLPTDTPIYELNSLAQTFNQMADQLQQSFDRINTALAESEEKFTIIFHSSPDLIALSTLAEERCVEANESFLDVLEYSREELIGQRFLDLGIWGDLDDRAHFHEVLQQNGCVRNLEVHSQTRSGQIKTVLLSAELIEINSEIYVLGIGRDISDRKQIEEQLHKTEQWLHQYNQLSPGNIYTLVQEPTGHTWFEYMSSAVEIIHEVDAEQILQDASILLNAIHPDDQGSYRDAVSESMQTLNLFSHQWRIIPPSGQIKWLQGNSQPERRQNGATAWHGVVVDITDRKQAEETLRQSETLNRTILNALPDLIIRMHRDGTYLDFKPTKAFPIAFPNLRRGENIRNILPLEAAEQRLTAAIAALQTGEIQVYEFPLWVEGQYLWQEARIVPLDTDEVLVVIRDLTQRNQIEAALQLSEARYRSIIEDQTELICRYQPDGTITFVNEAYCRYFGLDPEKAVGSRYQPVIFAADQDRVAQLINSMSLENPTVTIENRAFSHGEIRWTQWNCRAIFDQQGRFIEYHSVGWDITERKQAEAALQASENRFRQLAETVQEGFFVFEIASCHYSYVNPAYEAIIGTSPQSSDQGMSHWLDNIHPDDRDRIQEKLQRENQGENFNEEYRFIYPNDEIRWLRSQAFPLRNESGTIVRVVGTVEDISDRKRAEIALQESQARFQEIAQTVNQVVYVISVTTGQYLYISPSYEKLWGYSCESLYQNPSSWLDRIHPEDLEYVLWGFNQLLSGNQARLQYRIACSDGEVRWIESESLVVHDENGNPLRVVGLAEDITDRKQAEAEIQQLNQQLTRRVSELQTLFEVLPIGVAIGEDPECRVAHVNPCLSELLKVPLGENASPSASADDRPAYRVYREGQELSAENLPMQYAAAHNVEVRDEVVDIVRLDGTVVQLLSYASPLLNEQGKVRGVIGGFVDITERKQTEAALRASEELFRNAFDDAPIGVSLVSPTGQFRKVNACYCDIVGYPEAELLELNFQDITHPADLETDLEGFRQMLSGETPSFQIEKRYITKRGTIVPVLVNAAPVRDHNGQLLYVVAHIQDIRDRLKIERMKNEFVSIISHELRTPLTSIRGALGILGTGVFDDRPEKAKHMLRVAINNSERLVRLVDDILSLERLESGKVQLAMEGCQLTDLMQQAVDSIQSIADQSAITLSLTSLSIIVRVAPDAILQTLINLLSNAIKFSSPGDTVWLKAEMENGERRMGNGKTISIPTPYLLFSIADQGRGIPPDKLEMIFEEFQQVDVSDSREKGGTGLGLAICKKIVQQHGGQIWAESSLGKESIFYFTLPLTGNNEHPI